MYSIIYRVGGGREKERELSNFSPEMYLLALITLHKRKYTWW